MPRRSGRAAAAALLLSCAALSGCAVTPREARQALEGKTVVITGASSGIGRGVAERMAALGANVVLAARRTELLEEVAREAGGSTLVVTTDVSQPADIEHLAAAAIARFGRIDVWINDAGTGSLGAFEDVPLADHLRTVDVNLKGTLAGSWIALRQFRRQGAGTLVNVGSVAGRVPFPYYATYSATKHGIVGLGDSIDLELRRPGAHGIHVVTVNPFATDTPWFDHAANYSGRAPRMAMMDPPQKVVDAIVEAAVHPRPEINVGFKANALVASERASHTLTHRIIRNVAERMERAAPAPAGAAADEPARR